MSDTATSPSKTQAPVDLNTDDTQVEALTNADTNTSSSHHRGRRYYHGNRGHRDSRPREPRDPELEARKIYVGNLPYTTTDQELQEHFSAIGTIQSANISRRYGGHRSLGFGFVVFEEEALVSKAVAEMNKSTLGERQIIVENITHRDNNKPRKESKPRVMSASVDKNKGEGGNTTEGDESTKHSSAPPRKPRGQRNREPKSPNGGEEMHTEQKNHTRRFYRKPISQTGTQLPTTVYVRGLVEGVTEDDIRKLFKPSDLEVINVDIRTPRFRRPGFALVELESSEARDQALISMKGIQHDGEILTFQKAYAPASRQPKADRQEANPGDGNNLVAKSKGKEHNAVGGQPSETFTDAATSEKWE